MNAQKIHIDQFYVWKNKFCLKRNKNWNIFEVLTQTYSISRENCLITFLVRRFYSFKLYRITFFFWIRLSVSCSSLIDVFDFNFAKLMTNIRKYIFSRNRFFSFCSDGSAYTYVECYMTLFERNEFDLHTHSPAEILVILGNTFFFLKPINFYPKRFSI